MAQVGNSFIQGVTPQQIVKDLIQLYSIEQLNIHAYKNVLHNMGGKTELLIGDRFEGLIKVSEGHSQKIAKRIGVLGGNLPSSLSSIERLSSIELSEFGNPNSIDNLTDTLLSRFRNIIPSIHNTIEKYQTNDILTFSTVLPIFEFYVNHEDELEAFNN
ncbi:ferritin family protein [Flammeovirga aprica]|uniref:Uncharacterized protein n=1 Tax=Flammeovirga aprica JL-4 TaxID=694437 RepID=A0A7X9RXU9_9BACT|nr:hypothetical protein [Flammeovirga aprica]NME70725.1 hypothetical protein [Flammeovirga aprica JL-4]